RAGMKTIACVVVTVALLRAHIMADLPTDPVAVEVARRHPPEVDTVALTQKNATHIVTVEHLVVGAVAVEADVLDGDVGHAESVPLPAMRTPERNRTALRNRYVPGRICTVPPPRPAT